MNNTSQVASQWLLEDTQVQVAPTSPMMFPPAGDIYIMMSVCLSVCNEKSSLPPGSLCDHLNPP